MPAALKRSIKQLLGAYSTIKLRYLDIFLFCVCLKMQLTWTKLCRWKTVMNPVILNPVNIRLRRFIRRAQARQRQWNSPANTPKQCTLSSDRHSSLFRWKVNYSAPARGEKYCDDRVCLSVCVFVCSWAYLQKCTSNLHQGPSLLNILRQSYDYLMIMPKLRSTYDRRLIHKTSYEGRKAFLGYNSLAKS